MLARLGLDRAFLSNPVTWLAAGLLALAWISAVQADRHYTYTCSLTAALHVGPQNGNEYYVQPSDTLAYQYCRGRIPARFQGRWPLADCSPGGRARTSDGKLANFPQKCRRNTGNYFVF